ncbi:MAG TPA: hypothetical protein ENK31_07440, partial [Nannocystis exedens]|nr:hypothetical protein [Nannocystis exedens]
MTAHARVLPRLLLLALIAAGCSEGSETTASEPTGLFTSASQSGSDGTDSGSSSGTSGSSTSGDETCPDPDSCTTSGTSGTSATSSTSSTSITTGNNSSTGGDLPDDPCAGASDGLHCGSTLGGLASHQSLYQCMDGKTFSVSVCDYGCADNLCNQPPKDNDPCDGAKDGNGDYCGGTLPDGDPDTLYTCIDGTTSATKPCQQGCQVNPPGTADTCNSADLCQYAESGDGAYCGSSLKPGIADDVLFQCVGKKTQNQQTCSEGCTMMPPGEPDVCAPQQGGNECCVGKPPGTLTQSYSACGGGG